MLDKFHYKMKDGQEIIAPRFSQIPVGVTRKARRLDAALDQVFYLIEECLDEESLALYDTLTMEEAGAFNKAWQEDAGVTAGESSASSKK